FAQSRCNPCYWFFKLVQIQIDWRSKGVVPSVKDMGVCSAAWAFTATGALLSLQMSTIIAQFCIPDAQMAWFAVMSGKKLDISVQQVIDCSIGYGCSGDWPEIAFTYAVVNGSCTTSDYGPYSQRQGTCKTGCRANYLINDFMVRRLC